MIVAMLVMIIVAVLVLVIMKWGRGVGGAGRSWLVAPDKRLAAANALLIPVSFECEHQRRPSGL